MAPKSEDHDVDVERRPAEETPLLAHDLPDTVAPSRGYQLKVIAWAMAFIVVVEIGAYLQIPSTYQLMEQIICRKHYPGHVATDAADDVCKAPEVAGELAMIKGWMNSFDCIPRESSGDGAEQMLGLVTDATQRSAHHVHSVWHHCRQVRPPAGSVLVHDRAESRVPVDAATS